MRQSVAFAASRDRRAVERIPTSLRGKVFPGPIDCVIADFTKHGARLRFAGPAPSADRFVMVVWSSGVAFEAETRWRQGPEVGVRFLSSRDLRRPAPDHLADAQAAWRKRRPRLRRKALVANAAILRPTRRGSSRIAGPPTA